MIIMGVNVDMGKKKVIIIIVKKYIIRIYALELNLFRLITCVSYYRVYKQKLKLIAAYLTIL